MIIAEHTLPDGRKVVVYTIAYGRARLSVVNRHCEMSFDATY